MKTKTKIVCAENAHTFVIRLGAKRCVKCLVVRPFPNTREGLLNFLVQETNAMIAIARAKNQDYAGAEGDDPFANFTRVEALKICTPEVGFLTRITDKISRVASIVASKKTAVKDESIKDTLRDLANYALLLLAYLEFKDAPRTPGSIAR